MSPHKISRWALLSKGKVGSEPSWVRSHWSQVKAGEQKYHSPPPCSVECSDGMLLRDKVCDLHMA